MVEINYFDDPVENTFFIGIALVLGLLLIAFNTHVDAQAKFLVSDTSAYFTSSTDNESLSFQGEMIDNMNWVSQTSLGSDAVGDERLFCGSVNNGEVTELRFADTIKESSSTSISGGCYSLYGENFNIFVHTQPGGSSMLSEEDKSLETDIDYTCIAFEEMAVSPVTQRVNGLNCWKVTGNVENPNFEEINVKAE